LPPKSCVPPSSFTFVSSPSWNRPTLAPKSRFSCLLPVPVCLPPLSGDLYRSPRNLLTLVELGGVAFLFFSEPSPPPPTSPQYNTCSHWSPAESHPDTPYLIRSVFPLILSFPIRNFFKGSPPFSSLFPFFLKYFDGCWFYFDPTLTHPVYAEDGIVPFFRCPRLFRSSLSSFCSGRDFTDFFIYILHSFHREPVCDVGGLILPPFPCILALPPFDCSLS